MKLRVLFLLLAALAPALATDYAFSYSTTVSSAAAVVTLQRDATGGKNPHMLGASLYCSVACTVTLERDGTPATTSLDGSATKLWSSGGSTQRAQAYSASNVGTGRVIGRYYICAACTTVVDLSRLYLVSDGNFTFRSSSISGTAAVNWYWEE